MKPTVSIKVDITEQILKKLKDNIFSRLNVEVNNLPVTQIGGEDYVKQKDVNDMAERIIQAYANTKFGK